jgi:hypothetical protein
MRLEHAESTLKGAYRAELEGRTAQLGAPGDFIGAAQIRAGLSQELVVVKFEIGKSYPV